jgi:hypothetical protein
MSTDSTAIPTKVFGAKFQQVYTFEIIAVNSTGQSEPTLITVNTGEVPRSPAALDAIPYYPICFSAEQAGVTPIYELVNPDLYDKNKHLDGDRDGVACEPYAWD